MDGSKHVHLFLARYRSEAIGPIIYTACTSAHECFVINVSEPAHFKAALALIAAGRMHHYLSKYSLVNIPKK